MRDNIKIVTQTSNSTEFNVRSDRQPPRWIGHLKLVLLCGEPPALCNAFGTLITVTLVTNALWDELHPNVLTSEAGVEALVENLGHTADIGVTVLAVMPMTEVRKTLGQTAKLGV